MINFVISIGWQAFVFWAAIHIGFAMQIIDKATVFVKEPALCQFLQAPVKDGSCRIEGKVEGTLRDSWIVTPNPEVPASFELNHKIPAMLYDPKDWHMVGGSPAVTGLVVVTVVLSAAGIWLSFVATRRRVRANQKLQSAVGV